MNRSWQFLRIGTFAAMLFMVATVPSYAVTIPFNHVSSSESLVATITGTHGSMNFSLDVDVNDPAAGAIEGSFAMEIYGPGDTLLGFIDLEAEPVVVNSSFNFGSIALGVSGELRELSQWSLTVGPSGVPLTFTILVTSEVSDANEATISPLLTVEFEGDLQIASEVPLPAALPLFLSGLGLLGLMSSRRRRKPQPFLDA